MTVENSIRRYKAYLESGNKKAAEDMKQHMLNPLSKKYPQAAREGNEFLIKLGVKHEKPKR